MTRVRTDLLWVTMAAGLAVFLALAAWSVRPRSQAECPPDGVIRVAGGRDVSFDGQQRRIINGWRHSVEGRDYRAELVELPGVADQQRAQMLAWAQADGCPAVDVFLLDTQWIPEFAQGGYIDALRPGEVRTDGMLGNVLEASRHEGALWAVPFNTDAALLYYRTDMGIDPPSTLQELWDQGARVLQERTGDPRRKRLTSAYAPQFGDYEGMTVNALELFWAAGGQVVDAQGRVTVDQPRIRTLLKQLTMLIGDRDAVIDRRALDHTEADSIDAFAEGRVAFMRLWPYAYPILGRNDDLFHADGRPRFAVTTLPGPGVLGGQSLALVARTPERAAALELINFLVRVDNQRTLFSCGGFAPVLEEVYRELRPCEASSRDEGEGPVAHRLPDGQVETLLKAVQTARPRPRTPYYTEFSQVLTDGLRSCLEPGGQCESEAEIATFTAQLADRLERALRGQ